MNSGRGLKASPDSYEEFGYADEIQHSRSPDAAFALISRERSDAVIADASLPIKTRRGIGAEKSGLSHLQVIVRLPPQPNRAVMVLRPMPGAPPRKSPAVRQGFRGSCNRLIWWSIADWSLDQGCCGSLPLLKVSSGSQVPQKWSVLKVLKGCGPCGVTSPGGVSDWTF
jgi:hypothetical protein